ncbi:hypothetical protein B0T19DRAFT_401606 [Cercophora scortea]|uniref:RING-type domain-containing protein n=1 Tax=Cercophora scortea TaxID=314031 RepID=A0AAE0M8X5_9PEZI|nr:hypothetical protein B0T19DRAFT_401606 [Cercophora scortea]
MSSREENPTTAAAATTAPSSSSARRGPRQQPSLFTNGREPTQEPRKDKTPETQEAPTVEQQPDPNVPKLEVRRHEESKWQPIFEYLIKSEESRKGLSIPFAKCPMCLEEIDIPEIPLATPGAWQEKGGYLPCGHFVCNLCFSRNYATIVTSRPPARRPHVCTLCRLELKYPVCSHVVTPIPIDQWWLQRALQNASLKEEGEWTPPEGDHFPEKCERCTKNPGSNNNYL